MLTMPQSMMADEYIIRRIVFVNSAAYAYVDIPVDTHTALFGGNNLGKTSALNALKLFLLPEVNFRKAESKFGFKAANGRLYDGQESFQYYFPENESFLVVEAENVHGVFCLLLHRSSDQWGYGRVAVPVPYADIQPLFWDVHDVQENGGLGSPIEGLSLKGTIENLRRLGGIPLNDPRIIKDRLYSAQALDPDLGRFCLLPLKSGGTEREMNAWRNLIHLAFDISSTDARMLPECLATIIEGDKSEAKERLGVDFDSILDAYRKLKQRREHLRKLQDNQAHWDRFEEAFAGVEALGRELAQFYVNLQCALTNQHNKEKEAFGKAEVLRTELSDKRRRANDEHKEKDKCLTRLSARLEEIQKRIDKQASILGRIETAFTSYGGMSDAEVIEILTDEVQRQSSTIEEYRDQSQLQSRLKTIVAEKKALDGKIKGLEGTLSDTHSLTISQLDMHSATVLQSINGAFAGIKVKPDSEQHKVLEQFSQLFELQDQSLLFLGELLQNTELDHFDHEELVNRLSKQLEDSRAERQALDDELRKKNAVAKESQAEIGKLIQSSEKELKATSDLLREIKGYDFLKEDTQKAKQEREAAIVELKELKELVNGLARSVAGVHLAFEKAESEVSSWQSRFNKTERSLDDLEFTKNQNAKVIEAFTGSLYPADIAADDGSIELFNKHCYQLAQIRRTALESMMLLLRSGLIDLDDGAAFKEPSLKEMTSYRERLGVEFTQLNGLLQHFRDDVAAHNKETSIKVSELHDNAALIQSFVSGINDEFKSFSVSNLAEIRMDLELHPRFKQLLDELNALNFASEDLHHESLYDRLNEFCSEFFKKGARDRSTLSLDQVIEAVHYRYRKHGSEEFEKRAQSNGTTSMVNSLLLAILLRRLLAADAVIKLPLVMDEMASLDSENLQTAIQIAESHGFAVFGASPDQTAEIVHAVRNWINLGLFEADTRSYSKQRKVIYHSQCERLLDLSDASDAISVGMQAAVQV
tara:strand:- start:3468 stop:6428 length:2961 start_codon:yes stop_codon:yes gene_type:complete